MRDAHYGVEFRRVLFLSGWRELLSGAGVRSVSVNAAGIFTGSDAEVQVRGHALAGTIDDYRLSFESGERMEGRFLVTRLDYSGDYNGERQYVLSLRSEEHTSELQSLMRISYAVICLKKKT